VFVAVMSAACSSRVIDGHDSWTKGLDTARAAVAAGEPDAAARAWREAYSAAVRTRRWEPMLAVGDAALEVGRAAGTAPDSQQQARQSYLQAVIIAEQQRSLDGVLRSAEAFARIGDRAVVEQTFAIARRLAGARADAVARVTAVEISLTSDLRAAEAGTPALHELLTP
jgi:hypothetical protein